jgi:hypothetical protein
MATTTIPTTHEFTIDEIGDTSAERFQGKFSLKLPITHREQLRRDELRRAYLGQFTQSAASPRASNQAELFAEINVRITDVAKGCPSWWKDNEMGLELMDDNIILAINNELSKGLMERDKLVKEAIEATRKEIKGLAGTVAATV